MAGTTWNPADLNTTTLSGGNLTATSSGTAGYVRAVDSKPSGGGKYYWEVTITNMTSGNAAIGFCPTALASPSGATAAGLFGIYRNGNVWLNGSSTGIGLSLLLNGTILEFALDMTAKLAWVRSTPIANWNASGTANPATGVGGISVSSITSINACPLTVWGANSEVVVGNFGDSAFNGTVPSGYTAWSAAASTQGARAMVLA